MKQPTTMPPKIKNKTENPMESFCVGQLLLEMEPGLEYARYAL